MLKVGWKQAAWYAGGVAVLCWLLRSTKAADSAVSGTVLLGVPTVTGGSSTGNDYLTANVDAITSA